MAKRSPLGSQENSVTVSGYRQMGEAQRNKLFTLQLNNLDRVVLLANAENFQVTVNRLFRLRMAVDLDTEEVALVLPVKFALSKSLKI